MKAKVTVKSKGNAKRLIKARQLSNREKELAMIGALKPVRNLAQSLAPYLNGVLKASIGVKARTIGSKTIGTVGTNLKYARRLEFGFYGKDKLDRKYNQKPRPYLFPAWIAKRGEAKRQLVKAIKRLWKT